MDSRSSFFGLAVIAAIAAALTAGVTQRTPPTPLGAPAGLPPRDSAVSTHYTVGAQLLAESCVGEERDGIATCGSTPVQVRVFIATVPDGRDPLLDRAYDETVEALRRAFEKGGYLFDRYWEPRSADSVIVAGVKAAERRIASNRVLPSVLLLRSRDAGGRALVYLVPESPTTGVAQRAFRNALDEWSRLVAHGGASGVTIVEDTLLRVIGPTFSGSSASLAALLRGGAPVVRAATKDTVVWRARVVTGTATSPANRRELTNASTDFLATVHDDATVLNEAIRVLMELDIPPTRVAILRETNTAYGAAIADTTGQADSVALFRARWMDVPFPLNIASVRNEYARNPDPAAQGTQPMVPARRTRVGLESSLRASTTIVPVSALTAPAQDRVIDEIVQTLRRERIQAVGIVATDIRDKLFLASLLRRRLRDVLLFTLEGNNLLLRDDRGAPLRGMLVFGTYPLHVQNQQWLREVTGDGTAAGERLAFASEVQIGVYNATLLQLDSLQSAGLAYRTIAEPMLESPPVWVSVIGTSGFSPLRTRVVSAPSYAYAPARTRPGVEDVAGGEDGGSEAQSHTLSLVNVTSLLAGLLFAMLAYVFYAEPSVQTAGGGARSLPRKTRIARLLWLNSVETFARSIAGIASQLRAWWAERSNPLARSRGKVIARDVEVPLLELDIHTWGLARLLLFAAIFAPAIMLAARGGALRAGAITAAGAAVLLALVAASVALRRIVLCHEYEAAALDKARQDHPAERFVRQLLLMGGIAYGVFTIAFLRALGDVGTAECSQFGCTALFENFFHRAMALDSGVSPLVPIALATTVLFCWTGWHLGRSRALRDQTTFEAALRERRADSRGGDERTTPGTMAHLAVGLGQARWSLFSLAPRLSYAALSLLLLIIGVWLVWQFDRSLENLVLPALWQGFSAFDWLFRASVLAVFASIMWGLVRMHQIWNALRSVFERIADTPLLKAMTAVRGELAGVGVPSLFLSFAQDAGFYSDEHPFWNSRVEAVAARRWVALQDELSAVPPDQVERLHLSVEDRTLIASADRDWGRVKCSTRERAIAAMADALDAHWHGMTNGADKARTWLDHSAEFLAVQTAAYCEWGQQILRRLALFLLLALLLTTMMLGSYPFQPQHLFKLMLVGLVAVTVVTLFIVTIEMNRDEVLSALTNSAPGRVEWNTRFVLNMVVFGAIPILTLLSSELPLLRTILVGWIQPFVQSAANF